MDIKRILKNIGESHYFSSIERALFEMDSVMDLGCGAYSPIAYIKHPQKSIGVDIFPESIKKSKQAKIHSQYKCIDVLSIDKAFKKNSYDAVVALDLIEHLKKEDGYQLMEKMEYIAKKRVIILTPNGYYNQEPYGNNPHQVHLSGWTTQDFSKKGYTVRGMRGLRYIRGECATIQYNPWWLWGGLSVVSQYPLYFLPKLSYQLIAIKNL